MPCPIDGCSRKPDTHPFNIYKHIREKPEQHNHLELTKDADERIIQNLKDGKEEKKISDHAAMEKRKLQGARYLV
jgi:hypothetical protein